MRNSKTLLKILLAGIGMVGLAASAWAGSLATSTTTLIAGADTIQVAKELVTATMAPEIDLGNAAAWPGPGGASDRNLIYTPTIDLPMNSIIKFTFTNFAVKATVGNVYYLRIANRGGAVADGAPGAASKWQCGTLTDFEADADGNYTSMTFKVVAFDANGDGDVADVGEDRIISTDTVVISQSATAIDSPVAVVNKSLTNGQKGQMTVPLVKDETGTDKVAPRAATADVFELVTGLTFTVANPGGAGAATSTIDVNAGDSARKVFVDEGAPGAVDTPDTTHSIATILVTNNAEYGFTLTAADSWTLTIARALTDGVTGVAVDPAGLNFAMVEGTNQWTLTKTFGDLDISAAAVAVSIAVDGTTILQNGTWTAQLTLDTNDVDDNVVFAATDSHIWDTNGAQFAVGYLNSNVNSWGTSLIVTNRFGSAAGIQMDIWTDGGATATAVDLGELAAETTTYLSAATIQAAAQAAIPALATSGKRYMAIFTVNAPANQVHAVAFQNMPSGDKRTLAVQFKNSPDVTSWAE